MIKAGVPMNKQHFSPIAALLNPLRLTAVLLMGVGFSAITPAQAGTVVNASGTTVVRIAGKKDRLTSQYTTQVNGVTWDGSFDTVARSKGVYEGTFSDQPDTEPINNPQITCTGDVQLKVVQQGRFEPTDVAITWKVMGGNRCPSVGQEFSVKLREALPVADRAGNYTVFNARTDRQRGQHEGAPHPDANGNPDPNGNLYFGGNDKRLVWPKWEVVAADGKLNCRATPIGKVKFTFRSGESITADRDSYFDRDTEDNSWLWLASKQCYIRATSSLIAPISDTPWP
jgi:hypothetical protein